jgi:hypothetical protein
VASLIAFLIAVTVLGAALAIAHLALLVAVWRAPEVTRRDRWLALVPVLLPWVAWRSGRRLGAVTWAALLVAYIVVRLVG